MSNARAAGEQGGKKKVLVVGAGAAGLSAAWSLTRFPQRYDVQVWESSSIPGGVASSEAVGGDTHDSAMHINDGVQGGAPSYRNTLLFHEQFGFTPNPVQFRVSFGKGETAWNNVTETELVRSHRASIERFGRVLKWVNRLEFLFVFIPVWLLMALFRFPRAFSAHMVYPLTALFFGTGNQTPYVSSAIIARVFLDPDLRLFDYDPQRLLSQSPAMFSFKSLRQIYATIASSLPAKVHYNRAVRHVIRTTAPQAAITVTDWQGQMETFDEIIFACNAEAALRSLVKPSFWERFALGNVRYFNDVTITHTDIDYMHRYYDVSEARGDQYYVCTDAKDPEYIEMSFNLRNYQPGLPRDVFQSIFLDDTRQHQWSINDIKEDKIVLRKWWRQFSHTWRHFAFTVPFMRFLQGGSRHTWYCGGYTMFNTHEMAIMSGLAVAERLGAPYPFAHDALAAKQFDQLLAISHGKRRSSR